MSYDANKTFITGPIPEADYLAHQKWIRRHPGGRCLDLSRAQLTGGTIRNLNLRGAIFRFATFTDVTIIDTLFDNADLGYTSFNGVKLQQVSGHDANMADTIFRSCRFTDARFVRSNFFGAAFRETTIDDPYFTACNFTFTDLTGVTFTGDISDPFNAANLDSTYLPDGWLWWQGGASGPKRRMMRVWRFGHDAPILAHQGCIYGTPKEVRAGLRRRAVAWAQDYGPEQSNLWLKESLAMLRAGERYITDRTWRPA